MKCPHKNASKKTLGGVVAEALDSNLELEVTLIACMSSIVMGSVWYLNSSASFHKTRNIIFFQYLEEKYLQMYINMVGEKGYSMTGIGTVNFHRESAPPP